MHSGVPHAPMKRREFLFAAGAAALTPPKTVPAAPAPRFKKRLKLGISTYSYWHFEEKRFPVETVIERAAEIGVEAVDVLHRQMDLKEKAPLDAEGRAYCRKLKRLAFRRTHCSRRQCPSKLLVQSQR